MRNKIEEKVAKFIKETEVGMVVAPELNVDRDRKKWLQGQGFDDAEGLPEGREMQAAGVFEQVGQVFNINSAKSVADYIKGTLLAPIVSVQVSDLGGPQNVSILILVSLDKKEDWPNHILENSRYSRWHLHNDGVLEQFTRSKIDMKFRKTRVKTVDEVVGKINTYLKQVKQ